MEAASSGNHADPQQTSFGVRKVVDWKIIDGGRQMYKVEWHATWEPAEALATCQHLVDEFWALVNKTKANEQMAMQQQQQQQQQQHQQQRGGIILPITSAGMNTESEADVNFRRICDSNKAEVNRLIQRTIGTSPGSPIHTPNDMFQYNPPSNEPTFNPPSCGEKRKLDDVMEPDITAAPSTPSTVAPDDSTVSSELDADADGDGDSVKEEDEKDKIKLEAVKLEPGQIQDKRSKLDGLNYIENFTNPYVRLMVVCKVCGKEQSLSHSRYWREHFKTHNKEQAHKCEHCPKTFTRPCHLRRHIKSKHTNPDGSIRSGDTQTIGLTMHPNGTIVPTVIPKSQVTPNITTSLQTPMQPAHLRTNIQSNIGSGVSNIQPTIQSTITATIQPNMQSTIRSTNMC